MVAVLRRVEAGETVRITSDGRPVADLVPAERAATYVDLCNVIDQVGGVLRADDRLDEELRDLDADPENHFA